MKSVRVEEGVSEFVTRDVPVPSLSEGNVRLRIEAAFLPPYFAALPGGLWMTPKRPFTPGQCAIGTVMETSEPNSNFCVGQRVYCDTYVSDNSPNADHAFMGCFGLAPSAARHLARWPNGTFAEEFVGPEHCLTPIPDSIAASPEQLCRIGWFATALAGLRKGAFRAGSTVAINGASGLLGTSAALVALAIGAAQVRLVGRRKEILREVETLDPRLVIEEPGDTTPVDIALDCAGGGDTSTTETLAGRLRRFGSLVFVGALTSRASIDTSALMRNSNSLVGSFWFPRGTAHDVLALAASGSIDFTLLRARPFGLSEIATAMTHSVEHSGGLDHVALKP